MSGITLHNTLTGNKEAFKPLKEGRVLMYNCGPTVYDIQHIGNLSMFVFTDILRRTLEYKGLEVTQVVNITDFGHLSGDNEGNPDKGEDRMSKGLTREGLALTLENMKALATRYADIFFKDIQTLNIDIKKITFPFASEYIDDQIKMIETLLEKGHAYTTNKGVYFDTSTFPDYGKLGNINLKGLEEGARVDMGEKKNPTDFVLWKSDDKLGWQSPWGLGFPGWHIECSAMIVKLLGEQIDIHTGGIEHIPVHHNNEIAQAESATGKKPFSKYWLHREHLKLDDTKISKSAGNVVYISDLLTHRIHPLSFRYFLLMSHYRTPANFTWESVEGAQQGLENILTRFLTLPEKAESDTDILTRFEEAIGDDLNTPQAIALIHEAQSQHALTEMDRVFNISLASLSQALVHDIPEDILELKKERDRARQAKEWSRSDELRKDVEAYGYIVEDTTEGTTLRKTLQLLASQIS